MASEDDLPEELDKLKITCLLPQIKLLDINLPVELNPFFENDLKDIDPVIKAEQKSATTVAPSQFSYTNRNANEYCRGCRLHRKLPNVSLKKILKKSSPTANDAGNSKVLLKEPVLKALQTCLHPHNNVRKKLLSPAVTTDLTPSGDGSLTNKGMTDFRDLIDECRNLLSEDVDFSGRLNNLSLSNRNSKNFTTMQVQKILSKTKPCNRRKPILNTATFSLPSPETIALNEYHNNCNSSLLLQPPLLSSNISRTNLHQRNSSPEPYSNTSRCSTTCSQQAGNSASVAACDDVTIDELASYFDTFVHIPKKMSTMAEMMYI